jgi:hypothetical protein
MLQMGFEYRTGLQLSGIDDTSGPDGGVVGTVISLKGNASRPTEMVVPVKCRGERSHLLALTYGLQREATVTFRPQQRDDGEFILEAEVPCTTGGPHRNIESWSITLHKGRLWLM